MKTYDPNSPLISIHVPKSGGTSLRRILRLWFRLGFHKHYYDHKKAKMPRKHRLTKLFSNSYRSGVCIHGHFNRKQGRGITDYYPDVDQFITFLRDPVETHISHFHYQLKRAQAGKKYHLGKVAPAITDIDEFFEKYHSRIFNHFFENINTDNLDSIIMDKFVYIGTMEYYQESLDQLAEKLGKRKFKVPHMNKSPRTQRPSQSALQTFMKNSSLEYTFYNKVLELNGFSK